MSNCWKSHAAAHIGVFLIALPGRHKQTFTSLVGKTCFFYLYSVYTHKHLSYFSSIVSTHNTLLAHGCIVFKWVIQQLYSSWKIVDWDVKNQIKHTHTPILLHTYSYTHSLTHTPTNQPTHAISTSSRVLNSWSSWVHTEVWTPTMLRIHRIPINSLWVVLSFLADGAWNNFIFFL